MSELAVVEMTGAPVAIDQAAIMKHLNLDPRNPATQALILTCERYGLDPLLKHLVLISGNPYVTRDGYLHVAHASGQFDGMEVVDYGETQAEWWAKVSVFRKDMRHPFTYVGRYPKGAASHMAKYGPEMAMKCAEVMALRRAFDVSGVGAAEEQHTETPYLVPPAAAKRQLLEAVGGDKDRALELWGDRGSEPIPEVELDELLDLAEASPPDAAGDPVADDLVGDPEQHVEGDGAGGEAFEAPSEPPAPAPVREGPAPTKAMNGRLFAMLAEADIGDDFRHDWASVILARPITSFATLSRVDVAKLIDALEAERVG